MKVNKKVIVMGVVYRAPNSDFNLFLKHFEDTIELLISDCDQLICTGDFNVNHLNPLATTSIALGNMLDCFNLTQVVNMPTTVCQSSASLLDLIITSNTDLVKNIGTHDLSISDHDLIYCELDIQKRAPTKCYRTYGSFRNLSIRAFLEDLRQVPFHLVFGMDGVDDKVDVLTAYITYLFDQHVPYITSNFSKSPPPWITDNINLMIALRNDAL